MGVMLLLFSDNKTKYKFVLNKLIMIKVIKIMYCQIASNSSTLYIYIMYTFRVLILFRFKKRLGSLIYLKEE